MRADLNSNDELANAFSGWISSGEARVISNVTVFQGDATLFDFLLASPLGETALAEAIARLDPRGTALKIEMALKDRDAGEVESAASSAAKKLEADGVASKGFPAQDAMSTVMLESIGAIVTGHGAVHHALAELCEDDFVRAVQLEARRASGDWRSRSRPSVPLPRGVARESRKARSRPNRT